VVPVVVATFLMLVLAAPKSMPTEMVCPSGFFFVGADFCDLAPDDGLTAPITEQPVPAPGQAPAMPAGVLVLGMTAAGALVVVSAAKLRRGRLRA
jgi:hypothetical protein